MLQFLALFQQIMLVLFPPHVQVTKNMPSYFHRGSAPSFTGRHHDSSLLYFVTFKGCLLKHLSEGPNDETINLRVICFNDFDIAKVRRLNSLQILSKTILYYVTTILVGGFIDVNYHSWIAWTIIVCVVPYYGTPILLFLRCCNWITLRRARWTWCRLHLPWIYQWLGNTSCPGRQKRFLIHAN